MKERKRTFRQQCEDIAEAVDAYVMFYQDSERGIDAFEDDGTLHVRVRKLRACFSPALDSGKHYNRMAKRVLTALGMSKHINDRTLLTAEELEGEGDD